LKQCKQFDLHQVFPDEKFARDRRRYLHWVFEAKKRFGLSLLNYMVTSNHVHLLVKDTGPNVIAESMQFNAGRTAQE
jgi:putative transposase